MWKFTVRPDDGKLFEVTATTRDVRVWEKTTRGASYGDLMRNMRMTDLYTIAHLSATRQGLYTGTFKDFEDNCDLVKIEDTEPPDPTQPAQSAGD